MIEQDLIEKCLKRDRLAQRVVFEKLFSKMYAIAKRYTRNDEDALEVVNTAFLKIFDKIGQFNNRGPFEAWAQRIVVNAAIRFNKRNLRYREQTSFCLDEGSDHLASHVDNEAWSRLGVEELFGIIRQLPPTSQLVFNMFILDGFSHKEIAEQLGMQVSTSKWHVSFARQQLQAMLKKKDVDYTIAYA